MGHKKSPYRNVYWYKRTGKWLVKIHMRKSWINKETFNVGYYQDEETAARVADVAELLVRGVDAKFRLNFDGQPPPGVTRAEIESILHEQGAIDITLARHHIPPRRLTGS